MTNVVELLSSQLARERETLATLSNGDPATQAKRLPVVNRVMILDDLLKWATQHDVGLEQLERTLRILRHLQREPSMPSPVLFRADPLNLAPRVADELLKALTLADVLEAPDSGPQVPREEVLRILKQVGRSARPLAVLAVDQSDAEDLLVAIDVMQTAGLLEVRGPLGEEEVRLTAVGEKIMKMSA
jgi:hypothetical protein